MVDVAVVVDTVGVVGLLVIIFAVLDAVAYGHCIINVAAVAMVSVFSVPLAIMLGVVSVVLYTALGISTMVRRPFAQAQSSQHSG